MNADVKQPRIGLVHAVYPAIAPIHAAFARHWPQARHTNVIDDALPADLIEEGGQTPRIHARILRLAQNAADGADAVLFTCTAFDDAIDAASVQARVKLWKPNEAMFDAALNRGRRIGLIATFPPAVQTMEASLRAMARHRGLDIRVRTVCVPAALEAARAGDIAAHDRLVAQVAPQFAQEDVLLLAQYSTSTALSAVQAVGGPPLLSAPDAAVLALKLAFESRQA